MVDYNIATGLADRRLLPPPCNEHNNLLSTATGN
jgi:hypothetical protein